LDEAFGDGADAGEDPRGASIGVHANYRRLGSVPPRNRATASQQ
jgi:hypothetical protein